MSEAMQQASGQGDAQALDEDNTEKDTGPQVQGFHRKYNLTRHCIVADNSDGNMTHGTKHFVCFCLGQFTIPVFQPG